MSAEAGRVPANYLTPNLKTDINERNHRLKLYTTAAIAAGVGVMALAQPADGEVVITRKKIQIPISSYFSPPPKPVYLSLNNNGVNDFSFSLYSFAYHEVDRDLFIRPLEGGAVVGKEGVGIDGFSAFYASALARGAKVGPSAHFSSNGRGAGVEHEEWWATSSSQTFFRTYGNWGKNPSNTYLGVKFLIDGETHYGWVRLTVASGPDNINATITAYAYETEANKPIVAGVAKGEATVIVDETKGPSLGALAVGADGMASWRKQQSQDH
jgi:hypothetical protein